jgi:hypothetical protein
MIVGSVTPFHCAQFASFDALYMRGGSNWHSELTRYAILKYNSKMVVQNADARYITLYKVENR